MNGHSEMVCAGAVSIQTYVDSYGPAVEICQQRRDTTEQLKSAIQPAISAAHSPAT